MPHHVTQKVDFGASLQVSRAAVDNTRAYHDPSSQGQPVQPQEVLRFLQVGVDIFAVLHLQTLV